MANFRYTPHSTKRDIERQQLLAASVLANSQQKRARANSGFKLLAWMSIIAVFSICCKLAYDYIVNPSMFPTQPAARPASVQPLATPKPEVEQGGAEAQENPTNYKATEQVLQSTQHAIQDEIDQAKELSAKATQQHILNQIELERNQLQNTITVMDAQAEANANKILAASIEEIAKANATATIQAEESSNTISIMATDTVDKTEHNRNVNKAIYGSFQIVLFILLSTLTILIFTTGRLFYIRSKAKHQLAINNLIRQNQQGPEPTPTEKTMQSRVAKMLSQSIAWWNTQKDEGVYISGREQTQIPGYDKLKMSGTDWMEITDYLVKLHVVEKQTGRGGGTYFTYGNLHEWMLAAMNGRLERVDPLNINTTSSPPVMDA